MVPGLSRSLRVIIALASCKLFQLGCEGVSQVPWCLAGSIDAPGISGIAEFVILICGHENEPPFTPARDFDGAGVGGLDDFAGFVAEICEREAAHDTPSSGCKSLSLPF